MTPLGPVVTGVQPGSIGTVVVVVVGTEVDDAIDVVEEIDCLSFRLARRFQGVSATSSASFSAGII